MSVTDVEKVPVEVDEAPFEMANLRPKTTGLPFVVFVSQRGGARHDVRIKVSANPRALPEEMISVPIRPDVFIPAGALSSKDAGLLRSWVDNNRQTLVDYWFGDIAYTEDLIERLKPV